MNKKSQSDILQEKLNKLNNSKTNKDSAYNHAAIQNNVGNSSDSEKTSTNKKYPLFHGKSSKLLFCVTALPWFIVYFLISFQFLPDIILNNFVNHLSYLLLITVIPCIIISIRRLNALNIKMHSIYWYFILFVHIASSLLQIFNPMDDQTYFMWGFLIIMFFSGRQTIWKVLNPCFFGDERTINETSVSEISIQNNLQNNKKTLQEQLVEAVLSNDYNKAQIVLFQIKQKEPNINNAITDQFGRNALEMARNKQMKQLLYDAGARLHLSLSVPQYVGYILGNLLFYGVIFLIPACLIGLFVVLLIEAGSIGTGIVNFGLALGSIIIVVLIRLLVGIVVIFIPLFILIIIINLIENAFDNIKNKNNK